MSKLFQQVNNYYESETGRRLPKDADANFLQLCALCLAGTPATGTPSVTIQDGNAVCLLHVSTEEDLTELLKDEVMDPPVDAPNV